MAKLLHIVASPRVESYSTRVAKAFLDSYRQARPDDHVEVLDLFQADIPPFHAPQAKAKYAVIAGQTPRDEAETAWQPVIKTIDHFKGFDKYVISSPMWNFGIPYRLKQYIDVHRPTVADVQLFPRERLHRPCHEQAADAHSGKRRRRIRWAIPRETFDFQETYLRGIFGFIGFSDIRTIHIQGTLQNKPEQVEADTRKAIAEASDAAMEFAGEVAL